MSWCLLFFFFVFELAPLTLDLRIFAKRAGGRNCFALYLLSIYCYLLVAWGRLPVIATAAGSLDMAVWITRESLQEVSVPGLRVWGKDKHKMNDTWNHLGSIDEYWEIDIDSWFLHPFDLNIFLAHPASRQGVDLPISGDYLFKNF